MPATLKISPPRPPRSPPPRRPTTPISPQSLQYPIESRSPGLYESSTRSTTHPFHPLNPIPEQDTASTATTTTSPPSIDAFHNTLLSALDLDVAAPWPLQLHTELNGAISRVQLEGQRRRERRPWRVGGLRVWEVLGVRTYLDGKALRVEEGVEPVKVGSKRRWHVDERREEGGRGGDVEKKENLGDFSIRTEEDGMQGRASPSPNPELLFQRSNVSAKRFDANIHIPRQRDTATRSTSSRCKPAKQHQVFPMQNQPLKRTHNSARHAVREPRLERGTTARMNTSRRVAALRDKNEDARRETHRARSLDERRVSSVQHHRHHTHHHPHRHRRAALSSSSSSSSSPHYPSANPNAGADTEASKSHLTATQRYDDARESRRGMGRRRAVQIAVRAAERRQQQQQQQRRRQDNDEDLKSSKAKMLDTFSTIADWRYVRGASM